MFSKKRSVPVLILALAALTLFFLIDDVLYYLLFEKLFGLAPSRFLKWMLGVAFVLLNLGVAAAVVEALRRQPQTGAEGMIGASGVVTETIRHNGWVRIQGELWQATAHETIKKGELVEVVALEGLLLRVKPHKKNISLGFWRVRNNG